MQHFICNINELTPNIGVSALVNEQQIAVFKLNNNSIYAVANLDPFSQANVIARGITGEVQGQSVVASPIYKQHFNLQTGQCLEDDSVQLQTYAVQVVGDGVYCWVG